MPPAAPARPLWWLARWAARLLTGLAVAAAFTLGAWALPDQSPAAASPAAAVAPDLAREVAAPLDLAGLDLVTGLDPVGLATPTVRGAGGADLAGVSASSTGPRAADAAEATGSPIARDAGDFAGSGIPAMPPAAGGQPGLTALDSGTAGVTRGSPARVTGVRVARAPPHA
ncbi:hypothetical protein O3597_16000 [Verrucosispora sp. WMMA2044]|uniref:hypothetical protein n=1 Tax=Verrucosispora sp. WMMA2044 TaxID=3016419 RepID=UPI00248B4E3E|nr:hypothetical protein [Verrucosispora sp. WMMA2044]WBB46692.1 hypothetical protein O3597_16000 [Verrucosispora sp. WMMA2044]